MPSEIYESLILLMIPPVLKIKRSWYHVLLYSEDMIERAGKSSEKYRDLLLRGHRPLNVLIMLALDNNYDTLYAFLRNVHGSPSRISVYKPYRQVLDNARRRLRYELEKTRLRITLSIGISYLFPIIFASVLILKGILPALLTYSLFLIPVALRKLGR